jgi:hypothetical protein
VARLIWLIIAAILGLAGYDLLLRQLLGWTGYFVVGVAIGIASAVVGSYAHDMLSGSPSPSGRGRGGGWDR